MCELKKEHYLRRFHASRSTRDTWKELYQILARKNSTAVVRRLLNQENNLILTQDVQIAEHMNDYFTSIGKSMNSGISAEAEDLSHFNSMLRRGSPSRSMYLRHVTSDEVHRLILTLGGRKS